MKKHEFIATVVRTGIQSKGEFFRVYALINPHTDKPVFVVAVGKKQHRLATIRNRIKRRTMAIVREYMTKPLEKYAIVVVPSPHIQNAPYKNLCDEIAAHVIRIKNAYSAHRRIPTHGVS